MAMHGRTSKLSTPYEIRERFVSVHSFICYKYMDKSKKSDKLTIKHNYVARLMFHSLPVSIEVKQDGLSWVGLSSGCQYHQKMRNGKHVCCG